MGERLSLPPVVDVASVAALRSAILEHVEHDLEIDAGAVERIGGLGIQLLLSAEKMWAAQGKTLAIVAASPAFRDIHRLTDA